MFGSVKRVALALAFAGGLAMAAWPMGAAAATNANNTLSRQEAQQVLSQVSRDYGKAEINFLNDPNMVPDRLAFRYQYAKGLEAYNNGDYATAVAHFNNTEVLIHQNADWTQVE